MHGDHYDPFLFTFLKFLRLRIYKKKDITPLKFLYIRTESLLLHGKNIKKELHSKGLIKKTFGRSSFFFWTGILFSPSIPPLHP